MSKTANKPIKKQAKLRPKTQAFINELIKDPKQSHTQAYLKTHQTTKPTTARVEASKLLAKPNVQLYLDRHISKARNKIVQLIDSEKENIALQASEAILDRALGKPVNKTESINLNIDTALQDLI